MLHTEMTEANSRGRQFAYCSGRNSGIKVCSPFQPDINQVTYCLVQMQSCTYNLIPNRPGKKGKVSVILGTG